MGNVKGVISSPNSKRNITSTAVPFGSTKPSVIFKLFVLVF